MKKILILAACLSAVYLFTACDKNGQEGPAPDDEGTLSPKLTLTSDSEMTVGYEGGVFSITYTLENPADDGVFSAFAENGVDWCSDFDTSVDGTVSFGVAANGKESRECTIALVYSYADTVQTVSVKLQQEASEYDYIVDAEYVSGVYYGGQHTISPNTEMEYWLYFSDKGFEQNGNPKADGMYYTLIFYSKKPADINAPAPPAGTYTLNTESLTDQWTVSSTYSEFYMTDGNGTASQSLRFTDAKIIVAENGTDYTYDIVLTDSEGKVHKVTYSGAVVLENQAGVDALSTLEENLDLTLEDAVMRGYFRGTGFVDGVSAWTISMWPSDNSSTWCYQLYILCDTDVAFEEGIPEGTYQVNTTNQSGTMVSGYVDEEGWICGNWAYDILYNEDLPRGPMTSGTVTVERNDDTGVYTFTFDCVDDNPETPHTITGTISGEPTLTNLS